MGKELNMESPGQEKHIDSYWELIAETFANLLCPCETEIEFQMLGILSITVNVLKFRTLKNNYFFRCS